MHNLTVTFNCNIQQHIIDFFFNLTSGIEDTGVGVGKTNSGISVSIGELLCIDSLLELLSGVKTSMIGSKCVIPFREGTNPERAVTERAVTERAVTEGSGTERGGNAFSI